MISEEKGYTFEQDVSFQMYPIIKTPHKVLSQMTTKCIIGPNQRLIYGGESIVQKFIFSKDDAKTMKNTLLERIKKDKDGNEVDFTYLFSSKPPG